MPLEPQRSGHSRRINPELLPPVGLIAAAVSLAMVSATQRDGELVADLTTECAALGKAQVVGIRGLPAADQAGALGD
jgi:hypothetical protein